MATPHILLVVGGGIAAYKACELVRMIRRDGAAVTCVLTEGGAQFVTPMTLAALSENPVHTTLWDLKNEVEMGHIQLSRQADLVVVCPATADLLAKMASGIADDLATTLLLATDKPVLAVPAMNVRMWRHEATERNVDWLRRAGVAVMEPDVGAMACGEFGPGRLPEPEAILDAARAAIAAPRDDRGGALRDLVGRELLITAGGTREELDPVRFLANHSSGRQGWALAHAALVRGARVRLAAANVALETPPGADRLDVGSAAELAELVAARLGEVDALVMAAAVADFTSAGRADQKIKKDESAPDSVPTLALARTQDILRHSVVSRGGAARPAIVGFAAETGGDGAAALDLARQKARRKGADLLVFNDVSAGVFGAADNEVRILDRDGEEVARAAGSKTLVAHAVLDELVGRLPEVP